MSQELPSTGSGSDDRHARAFVRDIAPIWHDRFARLILRELPRDKQQNLLAIDVHCRHGLLCEATLARLSDSSRLLALQSDPALTPRVHARIRDDWQSRFYLREGDFDTLLDFPDAEYDLTIANLVLGEEVGDWRAGVEELLRITKPGGRVLATMCLRDTWHECDQLFSEVLHHSGLDEEAELHRRFRERRPTIEDLVQGIAELGVSPEQRNLVRERFRLLFRSGRELLFSPVVEQGPLQSWKAIAARGSKPQELLWRFKEAIDSYYHGRSLAVGVDAVLLDIEQKSSSPSQHRSRYWQRYPELGQRLGAEGPPPSELADLDDRDFEFDIEIEEDSESPASPGTDGSVES